MSEIVFGKFTPIREDVTVNGDRFILGRGTKPHPRPQGNFQYAKFVDDDRVVEFSGHSHRYDLTFKSLNVESENRIIRGGEVAISRNDVVIYGFVFKDIREALLRANRLIYQLTDFRICDLSDSASVEENLIDRKVYWRGDPSIVEFYSADTGVVVIAADPDELTAFTPRGPELEDPTRYVPQNRVTLDLFDQEIYWHRKRST